MKYLHKYSIKTQYGIFKVYRQMNLPMKTCYYLTQMTLLGISIKLFNYGYRNTTNNRCNNC